MGSGLGRLGGSLRYRPGFPTKYSQRRGGGGGGELGRGGARSWQAGRGVLGGHWREGRRRRKMGCSPYAPAGFSGVATRKIPRNRGFTDVATGMGPAGPPRCCCTATSTRTECRGPTDDGRPKSGSWSGYRLIGDKEPAGVEKVTGTGGLEGADGGSVTVYTWGRDRRTTFLRLRVSRLLSQRTRRACAFEPRRRQPVLALRRRWWQRWLRRRAIPWGCGGSRWNSVGREAWERTAKLRPEVPGPDLPRGRGRGAAQEDRCRTAGEAGGAMRRIDVYRGG